MKFLNYLNESRQFTWNGNPKIGWWLDNNLITFYHGTHFSNLNSILENGISAPKNGPTANWVSLALEPNTAFGYASMAGGETTFRSAGKKAQHVDPKDRVVIILKIPKDFVLSNMAERRGNIDLYKNRLNDKNLYDEWNKSDIEYYQLTEIRLPNKIDKKYIIGWMKK